MIGELVTPSYEEQLRIIRQLETAEKLEEGHPAYLVDWEWYRDWKEWTGYSGTLYYVGRSKPGAIDNNRLVRENGLMATHVSEGYDYEILVAGVWKQLHEWFGGGPDVQVEVEYNYKTRMAVAVTNPVSLTFKYKDRSITKRCYVGLKVSDIKARMMKEFDVPETVETRLLDIWTSDATLMKDDQTLQECHITTVQDIQLDYKKDDKKWAYKISKPVTTYSGYSGSMYTRNYGSTYSRNYGTFKDPGMVGLANMGNTCFFNSGVQCLTHVMPLVQVFMNTDWKAEINETNPLGTRGKVVRAFGDIMKQIWDGQYGVFEPADLKHCIADFAPQFSGWQQHDSHELIMFMLDAIHEDLNRCKQKPMIESVTGDSTNDEEVAAEAWRRYKSRNDSVVVDSFHGQLRSRLACPECKRVSVVFDPYTAIALPIQTGAGNQTVKALFCPLDICAPSVNMTVSIPAKPTVDDVSDAVTRTLGRQTKAVLGRQTQNGLIDWSGAEKTKGYYDELYIFEIDDTARFWVPCYVAMDIKDKWKRTSEEKVLGPFVIALNSSEVVLADVERMAEERLAFLWKKPECETAERSVVEKEKEEGEDDHRSVDSQSDDSSDSDYEEGDPWGQHVELNASQVTYKNAIGRPRKSFGEGNKIRAELEDGYYLVKDPLGPSFANKMMANRVVRLSLSGDYTTAESGFDIVPIVKSGTAKETWASDPAIATAKSTDLNMCFEMFAKEGVLSESNQWFCPNCRQFVCATKKMDIWNVPDVMVIQLKRFVAGEWQTKKLNVEVDYPDVIDMAKHINGPLEQGKSTIYHLVAVSDHMGDLYGGHYIAHAKVPKGDSYVWCEFDDSRVTEVDVSEGHSAKGYILIYVRADADVPVVIRRAAPVTSEEYDSGSSSSSSSSSDYGVASEISKSNAAELAAHGLQINGDWSQMRYGTNTFRNEYCKLSDDDCVVSGNDDSDMVEDTPGHDGGVAHDDSDDKYVQPGDDDSDDDSDDDNDDEDVQPGDDDSNDGDVQPGNDGDVQPGNDDSVDVDVVTDKGHSL